MTWTMPAETSLHERTWMAWPSGSYTLGDSAAQADEARAAWAAVAHAVADHEPVSMLVPPHEAAAARRLLSSQVEQRVVNLLPAELDDAWYRDTGPTFVVDEAAGTLGAVDWVFNGWGQQDWARWDLDRYAARPAIEASGAHAVPSTMVNEGGGLHTDGRGTVLVTRTVQLDPLRNPGWTPAQVEAELARTLGARTVIWLPRGLARDSERYGTKGHVDLVATFPEPGVLLVHDQRHPAHPDHALTSEVVALLEAGTDADGRPLRVVRLPAPVTLRDDEGWVDWSYVNHVVVNGAVVACAFDDPGDDEAADILAAAYPGREVVRVDARPLFARGGGIHCITQQQPARPPQPSPSLPATSRPATPPAPGGRP